MKKLTNLDRRDINSRCLLKLGLKLDSREAVQYGIAQTCKKFVGMYLFTDGEHLIRTTEEPTIHKIPGNIHSLDEATKWISERVDLTKRFGAIGYNDDTLAIAISHNATDGSMIKSFVNNFNKPIYQDLPVFPKERVSTFQHLIKDVKSVGNEKILTNIESNDPTSPRTNTEFLKMSPFTINVKDLACYNQKKKSPKSLTENFWLSHVLSAFAHNNKIQKHAGVCTIVDLRKLLKPEQITLASCNFTSGTIVSTPITPDMKLSHVASLMRKDMKTKLEGLDQLSFLKTLSTKSNAIIENNVGLEMSSMGVCKIQPPITDAFISITAKSSLVEHMLSIFSYSIQSPTSSELRCNIRYGANTFSDKEMNLYSRRVEHCLRNINMNATINDVFNELLKIE